MFNFYDIGFKYADGVNTTDSETAWESWRASQDNNTGIPERNSDEWIEAADEFGRGFIDGVEDVNAYLLEAINVLATSIGDLDDARETVGWPSGI